MTDEERAAFAERLLTPTVHVGETITFELNTRQAAFYLQPPGEPERQVSRSTWLRVERDHGFTAQHPGQPATRSWSADGWRGWWTDMAVGLNSPPLRAGDRVAISGTLIREHPLIVELDGGGRVQVPQAAIRPEAEA
jgi:hypothetical protein